MATTKQRPEQHLIDQDGEKLLRDKLPRHWLPRPYRPDYGLDFSIEVFKAIGGTNETLGEHFFIQLKSVQDSEIKPLAIFSRENVEKGPEKLDRANKVADLDTYHLQIETAGARNRRADGNWGSRPACHR